MTPEDDYEHEDGLVSDDTEFLEPASPDLFDDPDLDWDEEKPQPIEEDGDL